MTLTAAEETLLLIRLFFGKIGKLGRGGGA